MHRIIPFILTLLICCNAQAAQQAYSETIYLNNGLPSNVVHKMIQDDRGYLWLATENGLSCYDGNAFLNLNTSYTKFPIGIDPNIGDIYIDRTREVMWLRTASNNNLAMSMRSLRFARFNKGINIDKGYRKWKETSKGMVLYDEQNGVRLVRGHASGSLVIGRYHANEPDFVLHAIDFTKENHRLVNNHVLSVNEDSLHNVWMICRKGITVITPNGKIHTMLRNVGIVSSIINNDQLSIITDGGRLLSYSIPATMHALNNHQRIRPAIYHNIGQQAVAMIRGEKLSAIHRGEWVLFTPQGTCAINIAAGTISWPQDIQLSGARVVEGIKNYTIACDKEGTAVLLCPDGSRRRISLMRPGHNDLGMQHKAKAAMGIDQQIYFATQGDGLVTYNPHNGAMKRYSYDDRNPLVPSDKLNNILVTNDGMTWVMGENVGITRIRFNNMWMAQFYPGDTIPDFMQDLEIRELMRIDSTHIAVCSKSELWYGFDLKTRQFSPRTNFGSSLRACLRDKDGLLWFGTRGKGVFKGRGRGLENYQQITSYSKNIRDIWQDIHGRMWIVTSDNGVFCDNQHYLFDNANTARVLDSQYNKATGLLLLITAGGNYICNTRKERITSQDLQLMVYDNGIDDDDEDDNEMTRHAIPVAACGLIENNGRLWLGSHQHGLIVCSVDADGECSAQMVFSNTNGLINNNVQCIIEDKIGYMWVGTEQGISRISTSDFSIASMMVSYDVPSSSYATTGLCTDDGDIVLATNAGITIINPDVYMQSSLTNAQLRITQIDVDDMPIISNESPNCLSFEGNRLILHPDVKKVRLSFADLHYSTADLVSFQYRLDGIDNDWHRLTKDNHSTYTNLPPGKYIYRVRVMMASGKWSEEECLDIIVEDHWYNSWFSWLILLVFLALIDTALITRRLTIPKIKINTKLFSF